MNKRLAICALSILAAACGRSGTGPDLGMAFDVHPVQRDTIDREAENPPPTIIAVDGSVLRVSGYFETPCAREQVRGSASRDGAGAIQVRIWAERSGSTCPMRADPYTYDGRIHNLEPGSYRIRVEHRRDARRHDGVVLERTVTIP